MRGVKGFFGRPLALLISAVALLGGLWPASIQAGWREMANRLPDRTNAIVAFNVEAVLRSPLAVQQNWADTWSDAYQAGPVAVVPGTQRVLAGAYVKQGLQEKDYRVTIMEMADPVLLEDVGRSEGGYPEKVWNKMCVCAPTAYFVSLDPTTLASYAPPNRQCVFNWICDKPNGVTSTNLRGVLRALGGSTHIAMAIDVSEQYSASGIRAGMGMAPPTRIDPEKTDLDRLAHVLAGAQSIALYVYVTDRLHATAIIQLGADGDWFASIVKPVALEILDRAGISLPEVDSWTVKVDGNRITMTGDIGVDSMRELLGILGLRTHTKPIKVSNDPAVIGRTSRTFFRTICASLDSYPRGASYERLTTWVKRETAKIESLPLVNVDPELVAWSVEITKRMREVGLSLMTDRLSTSASVVSVQNPDAPTYGGNVTVAAGRGAYGGAGYYYSYDGTYQNHAAQNAINQENVARQRMQIIKQQQAQSLQTVANIMGDLGANRNAIRAKMTEKYEMEF